jgi:hypothetical protein
MGYVQPHGSYKLERNTINGKAIYSCADGQKGVVYIGGDKRIGHFII